MVVVVVVMMMVVNIIDCNRIHIASGLEGVDLVDAEARRAREHVTRR